MRMISLALVLAVLTSCSLPSPSAPSPPTPEPEPNKKSTPSEAKGARASSPPETPRTFDDYLVDWLQGHGEEDVVVDKNGVGLDRNKTRIAALLYGSNRTGENYIVEVEFRVRLSEEQTITDFVVGVGDPEDAAIKDALRNYTLTTFHVIYKSFLNNNDPHQEVEQIQNNGHQRELLAGPLGIRTSDGVAPLDLEALRQPLRNILASFPYQPGTHWIKVVYGQLRGKPSTVDVTMDNEPHRELTDAILKLEWPKRNGFYMIKLFAVIK
jgi:hypothetical protein